MVTAVVLIKAETDKVPELAQTMAELEGVSEVFSVAGQYDLVALVRVRENEDLARVISEKMRKLPGITGSETLISFKVYSKQDLDAGFQLALGDVLQAFVDRQLERSAARRCALEAAEHMTARVVLHDQLAFVSAHDLVVGGFEALEADVVEPDVSKRVRAKLLVPLPVVSRLCGTQVRIDRHLGVDDNRRVAGEADDHVRRLSRAGSGDRLRLFFEIAVLQHPRHLDDAAQLHLAPAAARVRRAQRLGQAVGRLAQLFLREHEAAQLRRHGLIRTRTIAVCRGDLDLHFVQRLAHRLEKRLGALHEVRAILAQCLL